MLREASDTTLLLHLPRRIAQVARKVIESRGHKALVIANPQKAIQAAKQNPIELFIFCIENPEKDVRLFEKIKKARPSCHGIALISPGLKQDFPIFRSRDYPDHLIPDKSPMEVKDLEITLRKVLEQHLFGMDLYGIHPARRVVLKSTRQKPALIRKIVSYFGSNGASASQLRKISLILEEMIMNAVFDAPTNASGRKTYYGRPRSSEIVLKPKERAEVAYGCSKSQMAISVSDPFGGFEKKIFFAHMNRLRTARTIANRVSKGAGMGLFLTFRASDELIINVLKGQKSEFIALLDLTHRKRVHRRHRRALHFFQLSPHAQGESHENRKT